MKNCISATAGHNFHSYHQKFHNKPLHFKRRKCFIGILALAVDLNCFRNPLHSFVNIPSRLDHQQPLVDKDHCILRRDLVRSIHVPLCLVDLIQVEQDLKKKTQNSERLRNVKILVILRSENFKIQHDYSL